MREFGSYAVFRDDFDRANQNPLASMGWSGKLGASDVVMQILSGAISSLTGDPASARYTQVVGESQEVYANVTGATSGQSAVIARVSGGASANGYAFVKSAGTTVTLNLYSSGAISTVLASATITNAADLALGLRILGGSLEGYVRYPGGSWQRVIAPRGNFTLTGAGEAGVYADGGVAYSDFFFGAITDNIQPSGLSVVSVA